MVVGVLDGSLWIPASRLRWRSFAQSNQRDSQSIPDRLKLYSWLDGGLPSNISENVAAGSCCRCR